jgi:5-methylcytosine-specific restriction endonuclease McrA
MVLTAPVLQLNKNWVPIEVITVAQAMEKIFTGRARAIEVDNFNLHNFESWSQLAALKNQPGIRTATLYLRVPEVVVLTNYGETPDKHLAFSRSNIYKRDRNTCQYCGVRPGTSELTIDHIIPRSRGGKSTWLNCVLACITCNRKKADRTLAESGLRLRHQPIKPEWSPRIVLARVRNIPVSWERFVSNAYWDQELKE